MGFRNHPKQGKLATIPTCIYRLGRDVDTSDMALTAQEPKRAKCLNLLEATKSRRRSNKLPAKCLAQLVGLPSFTALRAPGLLPRLRAFWCCINQTKAPRLRLRGGKPNPPAALATKAILDITWRISALQEKARAPIFQGEAAASYGAQPPRAPRAHT